MRYEGLVVQSSPPKCKQTNAKRVVCVVWRSYSKRLGHHVETVTRPFHKIVTVLAIDIDLLRCKKCDISGGSLSIVKEFLPLQL